MSRIRKIIVLNAGKATREPFRMGLHDMPVEWYRSKEIMLHIEKDGAPRFLTHSRPIEWGDSFVFTRLRATDQQFCGILYDYFARRKIPANDPIQASYVNSAEKISQMLNLAEEGIRVPETFIFREESFESNESYLREHVSFPSVFKTDGSKGKNVRYIQSWEELEEAVANKRPHMLGLVQPFLDNTFDTRTIVAFAEVLGTIMRARTHGYLNNIAQGAVPAIYELTTHEKDVARRAASVCKIDVAGVDMIHTKEGPVVIEVNKSPQVAGFESVHGFKVFARIAEIIRTKRVRD